MLSNTRLDGQISVHTKEYLNREKGLFTVTSQSANLRYINNQPSFTVKNRRARLIKIDFMIWTYLSIPPLTVTE